MIRKARFTPLVAHCALSARSAAPVRYEHIIVDEAQDVSPLEWRLLNRLNHGGHWTIVGDMNQRRSDWSLGSWDQLAAAIGIDDGRAQVQEFSAVYRSTGAILTYASALLPAKERKAMAIQAGGERPKVIKSRPDRLGDAVADAVAQLHARHPNGTLAVITPDAHLIMQALVRGGWATERLGRDRWVREDASLRLLSPYAARGLEFDAVVVVEPARFPQNLGRQGVLYTSLTRANKELVVVHALPLPDALRKAGR